MDHAISETKDSNSSIVKYLLCTMPALLAWIATIAIAFFIYNHFPIVVHAEKHAVAVPATASISSHLPPSIVDVTIKTKEPPVHSPD